MPTFLSTRYGDLQSLSDKTDGLCHLCHEPVELAFYGVPGSFGAHTVTVDHLVAQAHGGDDHPDNLLMAHAGCNSARGTRDFEDVRFALAGTPEAPLSSVEKNVISLCAGGLGYAVGGAVFATETPEGMKEFNHGAALASALVLGFIVRAAI